MDIQVDNSGTLSWTASGNILCRARCALGRGGVGIKAGEGDGVTPIGRFALRSVMVRRDRVADLQTRLRVTEIHSKDAWCDDPASPDYNRRITTPHPAGHENLWRDDALYDVVVEIGFNDEPIEAGRGSAIFIHVARPGYTATEGCVALTLEDLLELLKDCDQHTRLVINR